MHYINGRMACEGDPVIIRHQWNGLRVRVGVVHDLVATSSTCNAKVSVHSPGGYTTYIVTLGKEVLHAEDAARLFDWPE